MTLHPTKTEDTSITDHSDHEKFDHTEKTVCSEACAQLPEVKHEDANSDGVSLFDTQNPVQKPPALDASRFGQEDGGNAASSGKDDFPEGGLQAWLVVLGVFCSMFMVFSIVNSVAAFQDYLSQNQLSSSSPAQIGWIFSLELFFVFFCGIYVGRIFDAYGPQMLVLVGSAGSVLSMMLLGFCKAYYQFMLCYAVLSGLSGALLNPAACGSIAHFFCRRRGLATGIAMTAGSLGGVVVPLLLRALLPTVGFPWATRILGFVLLAFAIPANIFIRGRLRPSREVGGFLPDLTVLKDIKFDLCSAGMFLMEFGLFIPLAYISSYASTQTRSTDAQNLGFDVLAIFNGASFFGRWIPGLLSDKLGRFNVIIMTITLCAVSVLGIWLPAGDSEATLIGFAIALGFASGSNLSLMSVCLSQLCNVEQYGRYFGAAYFLTSFGTLASIPIGGALLPATDGDYWGLMVFAGVSYAAAWVCYATARVLAVGWSLKAKF